jgi:Flp pilus assembly protein protease CpaA
MSKVKIAKIVITLGVLVLLKIFMDSAPRISEPISNAVVFAGFLIFVIYYGISEIKKNDEKK